MTVTMRWIEASKVYKIWNYKVNIRVLPHKVKRMHYYLLSFDLLLNSRISHTEGVIQEVPVINIETKASRGNDVQKGTEWQKGPKQLPLLCNVLNWGMSLDMEDVVQFDDKSTYCSWCRRLILQLLMSNTYKNWIYKSIQQKEAQSCESTSSS